MSRKSTRKPCSRKSADFPVLPAPSIGRGSSRSPCRIPRGTVIYLHAMNKPGLAVRSPVMPSASPRVAT